ncbi:MAG: hypothetical protein IJ333_01615 [Clostridia bacterium]|nr:hypothetical protein [Clostridia bacterium]
MYDLETRTVQEVAAFHNGQNGIQIVGNIAYGIYGSDESAREWIYDIAAGKEWTKEESILNGWTVFAGHDDVLFCKDSEMKQYYRFLANGIAFEADMSGFENREGFSHITANAQWGVLLTEDSLFSVEVETNTVVHHQWERREVPYDGTDR